MFNGIFIRWKLEALHEDSLEHYYEPFLGDSAIVGICIAI